MFAQSKSQLSNQSHCVSSHCPQNGGLQYLPHSFEPHVTFKVKRKRNKTKNLLLEIINLNWQKRLTEQQTSTRKQHFKGVTVILYLWTKLVLILRSIIDVKEQLKFKTRKWWGWRRLRRFSSQCPLVTHMLISCCFILAYGSRGMESIKTGKVMKTVGKARTPHVMWLHRHTGR